MLRFDPRYKNISPKPALDFLWIGTLEEQLDCLSQVGSRLFDRRPLTSHVQLGAQRGVQISLLLDDRRVHRGSHSILPAATEMPWPVNDSIPEISIEDAGRQLDATQPQPDPVSTNHTES